MKVQLFCVYDAQSKLYEVPFGRPTIGVAIRAFGQAVKTPDSALAKSAADFSLWHIGAFDDEKGTVENLQVPVMVAAAREFVSV